MSLEDDRAHAQHYLAVRGVLEETFLAHGGEVDLWMEREKIAKRLNRELWRTEHDNAWVNVSAILWFAIHGVNGEGKDTSWVARPLPHYDGQKFLCPNGSDGEPWIPRETFAARKDALQPLTITEGPTKGLVLLQAGALPIALQGVWMASQTTLVKHASKPKWRDWDDRTMAGEGWKHQKDDESPADERYKLRKDLAAFNFARRRVCICFDADHLKNPGVRQAEIRLSFLLHAAGADVFQLSLWPLNEGKGIDDHLALKCGTVLDKQREALARLIDRAVPFFDTLDEHDITLVKKELHRVEMDPAQFEALAKTLAVKLKTTKRALGAYEFDIESPLEAANAVNIPPTAPPYDGEVVPAAVLDEIVTAIERFVWMKKWEYRVVALWIMLSYLHDVVEVLPILTITSPDQECGKTTLLKMVFNLCNRHVSASNISAAAIFRVIGDACPCLVLDEADSYLKEDEAMRGIINSGHERQMAFVLRVTNDKGDVGQFTTWCPKAIAMIGVPKGTILSRSIRIAIERKNKAVKLEKLRRKHFTQLEDLRRKISKAAIMIKETVRGSSVADGDDALGNRAGDNWEPLLSIAGAASEQWLKNAKEDAESIHDKDAHDAKSFNKYLLESIGKIIAERRAEIIAENREPELGDDPDKHDNPDRFFLRTTEDLLAELNQDEEAPWKERDNDKLTANKLRDVLSGYGVTPCNPRPGEGKKRARGYWSDELEKKIKQYE
jgi:uncharacterized protein DUF3854/uncharacterized protein DUF3631